MKKLLYVTSLLIIASMILTACGGAAATPTQAPAAVTEAPAVTAPTDTPAAPGATEAPTAVPATPTLTPYPVANCEAGKTCIRWFVGLGTGTDAAQIPVQEEVVKDFNASQDKIQLILEIVHNDSSTNDILATEFASGNGPDIVGPVGWAGSSAFYGEWMDIAPLIQSSGFDTSIFDPALIKFYQVEGQGQVGLPFAVFPGAIFYIPAMFDEAGLAYPPTKYGDKYTLDGKQVDWNWDTVTEVARRLTVDKNGNDATQEGFDPTQIVQVGYNPQWQSIQSIGTFYGGATQIYSGDSVGNYKVELDPWKSAFQWYYDGMWGNKPFIANGPLSGSPEFGSGNVFNSGKAAMGLTQTWYTCCLGSLVDSGTQFQLGIMPMGSDGKVHGRVDADTFRIWKGSKNPDAAFTVLAYLLTTGADKLLPAYGAMPAVASKTQAFFDSKAKAYPFVTQDSWNVFLQGLAYPDTPSAEQYLPNYIKANTRLATFKNLMDTTAPDKFNFDTEYQNLVNDLNTIYNTK